MTFIGCEESGYGSPGNGYGAHQVCGEKSATQKFSLPEVDEPLEQTCKLSYPVPRKVCKDYNYEITNIVCKDKVSEVCFDIPKLRDTTRSVEDTELVQGEPNCDEVILTKASKLCTEPEPVPQVYEHKKAAPVVIPHYGK